ncbi:hypothetical protein MBGDF03_00135 [Thermoplasmatales archaeon SCGC AB-540-F20]|nr:hypothetical protein MBGDF03_00135 [Thermoplasmatales archaeon SCGC AB-540-F20]
MEQSSNTPQALGTSTEKETYLLPTTAQADIISDAFGVKKERDGIRLLPVPSPPLSVLSNVSLVISVFTVSPILKYSATIIYWYNGVSILPQKGDRVAWFLIFLNPCQFCFYPEESVIKGIVTWK